MEHELTWVRRSRVYADRLADRPWPDIFRQRAKGAILAFFLLATPMAATAQERPGPAADHGSGGDHSAMRRERCDVRGNPPRRNRHRRLSLSRRWSYADHARLARRHMK